MGSFSQSNIFREELYKVCPCSLDIRPVYFADNNTNGGWRRVLVTPTFALAGLAWADFTDNTGASGCGPSSESFSGSSMMSFIILASVVTVQPTRPWGSASPRHTAATIFHRRALPSQLRPHASASTLPATSGRKQQNKSRRRDMTSAIIHPFPILYIICSTYVV